MNNIHKVIFNKTTQQLVVVSELTKSAGKPKSVSADSVDIVSVLQNFSEKRPLVDSPLSTSGQILAENYQKADEPAERDLTRIHSNQQENLCDNQKQNIANLSQITAGLASGVTGDSTASLISGAEIGKRAVEDNLLGKALNNSQADWATVAKGQAAKQEAEKAIREYIEKEHPTIYQTAEGAYYFINQTGKAVYIARELALELAPMVIAPEIAAGSKAYTVISRAALGAVANVAAQKLSGQDFNAAEMAGAVVSSVVTPNLKTTKDIVRFNAGVGMATGLASGGDGLQEGALSGVASYSSSKISNPAFSIIVEEAIQKAPIIFEPKKVDNEDK